ncbi:MAG: HAMP domain-containing protein [Thermoanaerobacteraceae bacterium]|nr:HAMP domain-containing protein [Thermoanaerobacteraceae bacterium]
MKQKRTIEKKILIPFLLVVLLPCLAVGAAAYWTGFQSFKNQRFAEAGKQLGSVTDYLGILQEQTASGTLTPETAKQLGERWLDSMENVILLAPDRPLPPEVEGAWWYPLLEEGNGRYKNTAGNQGLSEEWVIIRRIPEWNWTLVVPVTVSYFARPLVDIQKSTLLVAIIAAIVAVELTVVLAYHFSKPIKRLAEFCQELGRTGIDRDAESDLPVQYNDEIGVLARALKQMVEDMKEKQRLERKMARIERLASLGQMASGLAHEIRNPLAGIKTSLQVLSARLDLEEQNRRLVRGITGEIDRVNRIINNLLNIVRPREPNPAAVRVRPVIDETLVLLEKETWRKNIEFKNNVDHSLVVVVDKDHLKQIILNLSLNAIKAMPSGGRLTFASQPEGKIIVADTGMGIEEQELDKIFDPFYTTSQTGTGLGLSIVHQLVIQNRGEIDVDSRKGTGTAFILSFPVHEERRA